MGEPREPRQRGGTPRDQILVDLTLQEQEIQGLRATLDELKRTVQGIYGGAPGLAGDVTELKRWRQDEVSLVFKNLHEAQEIVKYVKGVRDSIKWFKITSMGAAIAVLVQLGANWLKTSPPTRQEVKQEVNQQLSRQEQELQWQVQQFQQQLQQLKHENQQLRDRVQQLPKPRSTWEVPQSGEEPIR